MPDEKRIKVTVTLPEYLHIWLSDTADEQYRSIQQQIVFLLARAFEGYTPSLEGSSNVPTVPQSVERTAAPEPAVSSVPLPVADEQGYPFLPEPPAQRVTTIKVYGIDKSMGATLATDGNGKPYRIAPDAWIPEVEAKFKQMTGQTLRVIGRHGDWLYLS
jgi:hypothetical protein